MFNLPSLKKALGQLRGHVEVTPTDNGTAVNQQSYNPVPSQQSGMPGMNVLDYPSMINVSQSAQRLMPNQTVRRDFTYGGHDPNTKG